MKKLLAFTLAFCLCVGMASCGNSDEGGKRTLSRG